MSGERSQNPPRVPNLWLTNVTYLQEKTLRYIFFLLYLSFLNHYTENWSYLWSINAPYTLHFQTPTFRFYLHLTWALSRSFHKLLQNHLLIFFKPFTAMPYKKLCTRGTRGGGHAEITRSQSDSFCPFVYTRPYKCIKHIPYSWMLGGGRLSFLQYLYTTEPCSPMKVPTHDSKTNNKP